MINQRLWITLGAWMMLHNALFAQTNIPFINFHQLDRPSTPNYFLVCPDDLCSGSHQTANPIFPVPVEQLQTAWLTVIEQQPRLSLLAHNPKSRQWIYRQRTPVFKFPDIIHVQLVPVDESHSTLFLYSHAQYGYSDFGVNRRRLQAWLEQLEQQLTSKCPQKQDVP